MQVFDTTGQTSKAGSPPTPPQTEVAASLHAELEQRRTEAVAMRDFHAGEASTWAAVVEACGVAIDSLNQNQKSAGGQGF